MSTPMTTYENCYFKIKVDFPSGWKMRCGSNTHARPESQIRYQIADNDLPEKNDDFRTLLFASQSVEGSPSIFSSKFSIVAHKHIDGFDLLHEMKQKTDLIECEFELEQMLGRKAQVAKIVQNAGGYNLITKVVAWEEIPGIWISIYLDGNSLQNFLAAEEILNNVKRT